MGRILFFLLLAAAIVLLAWQLLLLPCTITAEIGDFSVDMPVPVAGLGLVALFTLLYATIRLLQGTTRLPRRLRARRARQHRVLGEQAVTRALIALAAGDAANARREAAQARNLLGDSAQTLLLVSEAGRLAGRTDETEGALLALAARKDSAFLGLRGLLRDAMAREAWAEAADFARRAEAAHPGAAWLRAERAQLAVRTGAWAEALSLTNEPTPKAALATAAAQAERDGGKALNLARQAFELDKTLTPAALEYATRLRAAGRERRAQAVLREAWIAAPNQTVADLALAITTDPLARAQAAQRFVETNKTHPESYFLLARIAFAAGLTGEARRHLQAARADGLNQRRLWSLLADIEEAERGDTEAGRAAQRDALKRAAEADEDPSWHCRQCGAVHPQWHAACPGCGATGTLSWRGPDVTKPQTMATISATLR